MVVSAVAENPSAVAGSTVTCQEALPKAGLRTSLIAVVTSPEPS